MQENLKEPECFENNPFKEFLGKRVFVSLATGGFIIGEVIIVSNNPVSNLARIWVRKDDGSKELWHEDGIKHIRLDAKANGYKKSEESKDANNS